MRALTPTVVHEFVDIGADIGTKGHGRLHMKCTRCQGVGWFLNATPCLFGFPAKRDACSWCRGSGEEAPAMDDDLVTDLTRIRAAIEALENNDPDGARAILYEWIRVLTGESHEDRV